MFIKRHPFLFFALVSLSLCTLMAFFVTIAVVMWSAGKDPVKKGRRGGEGVGVVAIEGAITDSRVVLEQIRDFRENDNVKAIIIRINSPGGAVGPSQEIYREILKTRKHKKVVASLGSVAASGGYYVACAADGVMSNPGTITGSIGVIMGYTNFRELLEKIGMTPIVIKSGMYKDTGSPTRDIREDERAMLQAVTTGIHEQFVTAIAEGRNMEREKVAVLADGRIFTGEAAQTEGLVDRLGNFEDALNWAGELGGIRGPVKAIYPPEKKSTLLRDILASSELQEWMSQLANPDIRAEYRYQPGS